MTGSAPLVILIVHGPLRSWVVAEVASNWPGRVHLVDRYADVFHAVREAGDDPVLLICGWQLTALAQYHRRRWTRLASRATVLLVESVDKAERVNTLLSHVDGVLLHELHQGMAIEIIQSAKSGIRAFPAEMIDRLILRRATDGLRPGNEEASPPAEGAPALAGTGREETGDGVPLPQSRSGVPETGSVARRRDGMGKLLARLKNRWQLVRRG